MMGRGRGVCTLLCTAQEQAIAHWGNEQDLHQYQVETLVSEPGEAGR
jgi:hypothetical protein